VCSDSSLDSAHYSIFQLCTSGLDFVVDFVNFWLGDCFAWIESKFGFLRLSPGEQIGCISWADTRNLRNRSVRNISSCIYSVGGEHGFAARSNFRNVGITQIDAIKKIMELMLKFVFL
jgi:hypothetical protein